MFIQQKFLNPSIYMEFFNVVTKNVINPAVTKNVMNFRVTKKCNEFRSY